LIKREDQMKPRLIAISRKARLGKGKTS